MPKHWDGLREGVPVFEIQNSPRFVNGLPGVAGGTEHDLERAVQRFELLPDSIIVREVLVHDDAHGAASIVEIRAGDERLPIHELALDRFTRTLGLDLGRAGCASLRQWVTARFR